jgi:hypothetical protein
MSTSNKPAGAAWPALHAIAALFLGAGLAVLPGSASSGTVQTDDKDLRAELSDKGSVTKARPAPPGGGAYTLRCWQYGKLIFEEDDLAPPPDTQTAYRLTLRERAGKRASLHLVETLNATCLVQQTRETKPGGNK